MMDKKMPKGMMAKFEKSKGDKHGKEGSKSDMKKDKKALPAFMAKKKC